ncbi:MAG: NIPSNAP family protein [Acidobacteriota bacterium]
MRLSRVSVLAASTTLLVMGFAAGTAFGTRTAAAQAPRVFELRTYTAPDGKLADLHARFRNHTRRIFEKHGMTNIGYWKPLDAPLANNTLLYVLAYPSREAAKASWDAFRNDPEWKKVASETQANGPIVAKVESIYLEPADYSAIK